MKLKIKTPSGDEVDLDVQDTETVGTVKTMIESAKPWLGPVDCMQLKLKGTVLADDAASLSDAGCQDGVVMEVVSIPKTGGNDPNKGAARPGEVPTSGFKGVSIVVSGCSNAKTNGTYIPVKPYLQKAAWFKAASDVPDEPMPQAEQVPEEEEGKEGGYPAGDKTVASKDSGERFIFFSDKMQKWFAGDALDEGGFTFVASPGKVEMPPLQGWNAGAVIEFQSDVADGALNVHAACKELDKLANIDPWADQETCYVTMLKVLGNIVANPTEGKFFSLKIENAAIQKKILSHDGARGFLEALGFRENAGALTLPMDHHGDAKLGQDVLQGFANERAYIKIRKDRHAVAAEEAKKAEAEAKKVRKPTAERNSYGGGGGGGAGGGPMRS